MKMHERIRQYILNNGLKINYVAEKSNIELKRFYRVINGETKLLADDFELICEGLGVAPEIFFKNNFLETKKITA
ncbi:helix-turn-helix domain-containing protein [Lysinibacillus sp. NPDC047702]|uniref:helix-turn-helix domain-containing protein n=1 Tax=unclassified Lysinibacillus TaxID=2636778 RepID=UPI003D07315F